MTSMGQPRPLYMARFAATWIGPDGSANADVMEAVAATARTRCGMRTGTSRCLSLIGPATCIVGAASFPEADVAAAAYWQRCFQELDERFRRRERRPTPPLARLPLLPVDARPVHDGQPDAAGRARLADVRPHLEHVGPRPGGPRAIRADAPLHDPGGPARR